MCRPNVSLHAAYSHICYTHVMFKEKGMLMCLCTCTCKLYYVFYG